MDKNKDTNSNNLQDGPLNEQEVKNNKRKFLGALTKKHWKYGGVSAALAILVTAGIILLNVVAVALGSKIDLEYDLTKNGKFSLTSQTTEYIKGLKEKVTITVLCDENTFVSQGEHFAQANTILNKYAKSSGGNIALEYIDVTKNPAYLQTNYPNEEITEGSIVVKSSNGKSKALPLESLFEYNYSMYGQEITGSKVEQEITSAIVYLTSENQTKIAVIKSSEEQNLPEYVELLKKNNYSVEDITLLTQAIPDDVSVGLILGPKKDYDKSAIEKLENFLSKPGKSLVYFAHPGEANLPNLSGFLAKWGLKVNSGILYETDSKKITVNGPFEAICDYVSPVYSNGIKNLETPVLVNASRPVEILKVDGLEGSPLLQFSKTSGVVPPNAARDFDLKKNVNGPNICAAISTKKTEDTKTNNVVAIGSFSAVSGPYLSSNSINNSLYFTNLVNIITNREDVGIVIEAKSNLDDKLGIKLNQIRWIGMIFTVVLPIVILAIGVFVFVRRNK